MTKTLIKNADVITLNEDGQVLMGTDIAIADDRILALGDAPAGFTPDEVIEATDRVIMPGFFNAHTHSAITLIRGWADDLPFDRWLNERIWVSESALEEEDVYWGAALAAAEMIRSGTVGFADHYFYMDQVAKAVEESGLRANLAWCVFGLGEEAEIGTDLEGSIEFMQRWQGAAEGRIRTVLGPHAPYSCPPEFLAEVAQRAAELGVGLHIHLSESEEQVKDSLAKHGLTPVAHLESLGILDVPTIAAHCIHLTQEDQEILLQKQVNVVQCPGCHMKLGLAMTPVPELLARGINVALGTDSTASNNDLDMLQEALLASLVQKARLRDPVTLPGDTVLRLATRNGAKAMGFPESGVIAPGQAADLIIFDFDKPHLRPRHDLVSNIVYAAKPSDVSHVMVAGRLLMRDGELLTLDEERIMYEAERRARRIVGEELRMVRKYQV